MATKIEITKELIEDTYFKDGVNVTGAAAELMCNHKTLRRLMKEYGIEYKKKPGNTYRRASGRWVHEKQ